MGCDYVIVESKLLPYQCWNYANGWQFWMFWTHTEGWSYFFSGKLLSRSHKIAYALLNRIGFKADTLGGVKVSFCNVQICWIDSLKTCSVKTVAAWRPSGSGVSQQWPSQLPVRLLRVCHGWRRPRPHRGPHHPEGRRITADRVPAGQLRRHTGPDLGRLLQRTSQTDCVRRSRRV